MLRLMEDEPWFAALHAFHARGGAILATCAGTILLARTVSGPAQRSLVLLDVALVVITFVDVLCEGLEVVATYVA